MIVIAEIIKTIKEIENIFRLVTLTILKIDLTTKESHKRVRFPWGSNLSYVNNSSSPMWNKDEDICIIYVLPYDDLYNRQRNISYEDMGEKDLLSVTTQTDVHLIRFVNYGPLAYEYARDIRNNIFKPEILEMLNTNYLFPTGELKAIQRVPELINNEWWNRADFEIVVNDFVRLEDTIKTIEKITVDINKEDGKNVRFTTK